MVKVGDRVGAIKKSTPTEVFLFGFGVFTGLARPPVGPFGITAEELAGMEKKDGFQYTNPRILLDNGRVVWGLECWWGSEAKVREMIGDKTVVTVDPVIGDSHSD
jgi:hypothetical protein